MRNAFVLLLALLGSLIALPAAAFVEARVDISSQRMTVYVDGYEAHDWAISSGRMGYETPSGVYRPQSLAAMHYSRKYNNSPMPYTVFFNGGYAIHGTYETRRLGSPASHGCIRLHPSNAAAFYDLVRSYGMRQTRIVITR